MCIICIKNKGVAMPTEETIRTMFFNNPDGSGYMYAKDGMVVIRKGFMTAKALLDSLETLNDKIDVLNTPIVLHFRIGTAGGNIQANTHPFPLSSDIKMLQHLKVTCNIGVVHNGIINITTSRTDISDTMEYITSQMSLLYKLSHNFYKNEVGQRIVENAITSKMAILDGSANVYKIGHFITDKNTKLVYSNTTYEPYNYPSIYGKYGYYENMTDDEWDEYYANYETRRTIVTHSKSTSVRNIWIMELDDSDYIKLKDGTAVSADCSIYYIDVRDNVYEYSFADDVCELVDGAVAHAYNGDLLKFDINSADTQLMSARG